MAEKRRRFSKRIGCLICICVFIITALALRQTILPAMGRWLDVGEPPQSADFVLVLPGHYETRPFVGAALAKVGLAKQVLVIETASSPDVEAGFVPPNHEIVRETLLRRGIKPTDIILINAESTSTFEDATALLRFLGDRADKTVTIVTNDFHTRRTRWVFRKVFGDRHKQLHFVSAPRDECHAENWWHSRLGVSLYVSEYIKLIYYFFRYGSGWIWTGVALLGIVGAVTLCRSRRRRNT